MRLTKTVNVIKETTVDILCNMCGLSLSNEIRHSRDAEFGFSGLNEVEVVGGYDSEAIGDGTSYTFSICEHCLVDKVFTQFTIPPLNKEY